MTATGSRDFRSDNTLGASPEILGAITRAGEGTATSYGGDDVTRRVRERCREIFDRDIAVFPVITGTAGNALGVSALTPPWGAVFCHEDAHIHRDELGAVEFFSGGAKVITIPGADGKLHPDDLARAIEEVRDSKRTAVPACVSLTNATEAGTVYTNDELSALIGVARRYGLGVHMDGARFANAAVTNGARVDGVDVLTLGATKNGALTSDLVVLFRTDLAEELALRHHRSGHRPSKMRFLSAQLEAYLTDDLWLRNARHANAMAQRLRERIADVVEIVRPVDANMLFVRFSNQQRDALFADGFQFFDWPIFGRDVYRLVMGFATSEQAVDEFGAAIRSGVRRP
jgi:threonine aldolase